MTAFLLELLLEIVAELLLGFGFESVAQLFRPVQKSNGIIAISGLVLISGLIDSLSFWLLPYRIVSNFRFPWLSVFVSPVACGVALMFVGHWRESRGQHVTFLSTFWGGYSFALAIGLTRFILLRSWPPSA